MSFPLVDLFVCGSAGASMEGGGMDKAQAMLRDDAVLQRHRRQDGKVLVRHESNP